MNSLNSAYETNLKGNEFLEKADYENALSMYLQAISLNSNEPVFYHNAGVCLMITNENRRAATLFEEAIKKGSKFPETVYYFFKTLYESGNFLLVTKTDYPVSNEYKIEILVLKAKAALKLGRYDQVRGFINQIKLMGYSSQELELIEKMIP